VKRRRVSVILAVCRRTWLRTARRPVTLTFSLLQPVMWILFFGFLFHRYDVARSLGTGRYLDFLVPGVCAMTVLFGASQAGVGLIRDIESGFLERMLSTPADASLVLIGKLLADVLRLLGQAFLLLLLGRLLGAAVSLSVPALAAVACALGLFGFGFCSLSCVVALLTRAQERMATFVHLVNMPLLFTSSALVPVRDMPDWLRAVAAANPLSAAVDTCRSALLLGDYAGLGSALGFLAIAAIGAFVLAVVSMRNFRANG
jgi:ABC-2 type transport system permease protein